jgi:hypothetical protein
VAKDRIDKSRAFGRAYSWHDDGYGKADFVDHQYLDRSGNPIERTPDTHPYSFEGYVTWRKPGFGFEDHGDSGVYTDRLSQWDYEKTRALQKKHFGNDGDWWDRRPASQIEAFLRDWEGDPELELVLVLKCCNVSSGYPLWYFEFRHGPGRKAEIAAQVAAHRAVLAAEREGAS